MFRSTDDQYSVGEAIRKLRERKAMTREALAEKANVSLSTLRDIERGKRNPRPRTLQKIALALETAAEGLSNTSKTGGQITIVAEKTTTSSDVREAFRAKSTLKCRLETLAEVHIKAARFIPLFLGPSSKDRHFDENIFKEDASQGTDLHKFPDGFAVVEIQELLHFQDIFHMLRERRRRHLDIIAKKFNARPAKQMDDHPIFSSSPPLIEYVMSVHQLLNFEEHDEISLCAMCEPSLVGITDDPAEGCLDEICLDSIADSVNEHKNNISQIKFENLCLYASWSNIILADKNAQSVTFDNLRKLQVQLQKLWFQTYTYDAEIDRIIQAPTSFNIENVTAEINISRVQVFNFCKIDSVGSWHMNQLRSALVSTSKLREISDGLIDKLKILRTIY